MQHIPVGVDDVGEGAEEDQEGDEDGVEQLGGRHHVGQLRV